MTNPTPGPEMDPAIEAALTRQLEELAAASQRLVETIVALPPSGEQQ
ncbi:hypothetical protein [Streptomyces globosus]